jgi:hypothetical protein
MMSFATDGNILTDRRVISYWTDPTTDEFLVESATLSEIAGMQVYKGDFLTNTILILTRLDGTNFQILLSTEAQGDDPFISELKTLVPVINLEPATTARSWPHPPGRATPTGRPRSKIPFRRPIAVNRTLRAAVRGKLPLYTPAGPWYKSC